MTWQDRIRQVLAAMLIILFTLQFAMMAQLLWNNRKNIDWDSFGRGSICRGALQMSSPQRPQ